MDVIENKTEDTRIESLKSFTEFPPRGRVILPQRKMTPLVFSVLKVT